MDSCTRIAFQVLRAAPECRRRGPQTTAVDARPHGRQVWEHLLSVDQSWLSVHHLPGTLLGTSATRTGEPAAIPNLGRYRREAISGPSDRCPSTGEVCVCLTESTSGQESHSGQPWQRCWRLVAEHVTSISLLVSVGTEVLP